MTGSEQCFKSFGIAQLQGVQGGDEKLNLEAVQIAMLFHGYTIRRRIPRRS